MHIVECHLFTLEICDKFTQWEAKTSVWSQAKNARPCPKVNLRAVSETDQSILREHWVFISTIIPVYNDLEDFGIIIK